jgi:hypothetical protein
MVKKLAFLVSTLLCLNAAAQDQTEPTYDVKSLKDRLQNGGQQKATAAERMKAARGDKSTLKMLQEDNLNYKLPNGTFVPGMLLPNGTLSPAVKTKLGVRPACVTKTFELFAGEWDNEKAAVRCNVPQSELAYIDELKFDSSVSENKPVVSNKYGAKAPINGAPGATTVNANSVSSANATKLEPSAANGESTPKPSQARTQRNEVSTVAPVSNSGGYVPAPRNSTNLNAKAGTITSKTSAYGIPRGTWIRAELQRNATSTDSNNIEFVVTESVIGKYKTLDAGTILFASKSFNSSSKRLEALTNVAVTPDGEEVPGVSAYVYASDQTAGLSGTIVRDRQSEAISAGKTGVLSAVAGALPGGAGLASGVVSNVSGEILGNEKNNVQEAPSAFIQVAPQTVWLRTAQKI